MDRELEKKFQSLLNEAPKNVTKGARWEVIDSYGEIYKGQTYVLIGPP